MEFEPWQNTLIATLAINFVISFVFWYSKVSNGMSFTEANSEFLIAWLLGTLLSFTAMRLGFWLGSKYF